MSELRKPPLICPRPPTRRRAILRQSNQSLSVCIFRSAGTLGSCPSLCLHFHLAFQSFKIPLIQSMESVITPNFKNFMAYGSHYYAKKTLYVFFPFIHSQDYDCQCIFKSVLYIIFIYNESLSQLLMNQ